MRKGQIPVTQVDFHEEIRPLDAEDMDIMHLPRRYWSSKPDDLPPELRLREVVDGFLSDPTGVIQSHDPTLFVFSGPPDTGKTTAAAIMAKAARARRFSVLYVDVARIQRYVITDEVTADGELTFAERMQDADVLVLDGLGRENVNSEFGQSEIESILRLRQDDLRLTIITTNLTGEELDKVYPAGFVALLGRTAVGVDCPFIDVEGK